MDDKKRSKDGALSSIVEKSRNKTGGRKKGTPNKKTQAFQDSLSASGFNLSKAIVDLYNSTEDDQIKFWIIALVTKHSVPVPRIVEEPIEAVPVVEEEQLSTHEIRQLTNGK